MASNHPIDRLFREKTGNLELNPSANAWDNIQAASSQANQGSRRLWQIAAAVSLIAVSVLTLWMIRDRVEGPTLAEGNVTIIGEPSEAEVLVLEIPEKIIQPVVSEPELVKPKLIEQPIEPTVKLNETEMLVKEDIPMLHLDKMQLSKAIVFFEEPFPIHTDVFNMQKPEKINIIYYTHATSAHADASKKKLAKIIDYARTTSPVDWVGDIRDKKDEWIDTVFSLD